jgi:hypothetical protein
MVRSCHFPRFGAAMMPTPIPPTIQNTKPPSASCAVTGRVSSSSVVTSSLRRRSYADRRSLSGRDDGGQEDPLLPGLASVDAGDGAAVEFQNVAREYGGEGADLRFEEDLGFLGVEPLADQREPCLVYGLSTDRRISPSTTPTTAAPHDRGRADRGAQGSRLDRGPEGKYDDRSRYGPPHARGGRVPDGRCMRFRDSSLETGPR